MIVVLDYGMGNLGSIANMLRKLRVEHSITSEPGSLEAAEAIILPGVGAFDRGMAELRARGLRDPLEEAVLANRIPTLGLCLGMQLLTRGSEEGEEPGLAFLQADVRRLDRADVPAGRIPHMGWNQVVVRRPGLLPDDDAQRYYFVHSFVVSCDDDGDVLATTNYGRPFVSAVQRGNIAGVQFHPEKSHRFGLELLRRFCDGTGGVR